jgi:eukaryotic-like serine/threonine-protein kinase
VIHRDLKPGNVMLTKTGAKLLDFGLAKLTGQGEDPAAGRLTSTGTSSMSITGQGVILGTLPYMAPEQVERKPTDARTDLWALGAILCEMVTGKRAFEGTSRASLISAIMSGEPAPLSTLQPRTPPGVDRLVRRCLAKSPDDRWDSAHDVADELRWIQETNGVSALTSVHPWRRLGLQTALLLAGALAMAAVGAGVMWRLRPSPPQASPARLSLDVAPAEEVNTGVQYSTFLPTPVGARTAFAWTPDGRAVVFVGRRGGVQQLYVRRLDAAEARPLEKTEGAKALAVSPDGQWVAFWANGAIRKVPVGGGPVVDLASGVTDAPCGLAWDAGGRVFFARDDDGRIWAIPPEGAPAAVTKVGEGEIRHTLPWLLPGDRVLLYTVRKRMFSWGDEEVVAHTLATGERKVLLKDATDARYVSTGHLVFLRRGVLFAVPFDAERLEVRGAPVAVLDAVAQALTGDALQDRIGAGQFAIAATGALAWVPGPVVPYPDAGLVTVDRRGQITPLPAPVRSYGLAVRVSPDGRRLAVTIQTLTEVGLWVYDMGRGPLTSLGGTGEVMWPTWSPDGRRLVFSWLSDGRRSLAVQPADGTAPPQVLVAGELWPSSFTPDGRRLVAERNELDIAMVTVENGQVGVQPLIQTPHYEGWAEFSPDGRWLAYASDVSGRLEVYVRPYPGPGPTEQVSLEGGYSLAWHPNGRELFFVEGDDPDKFRMMAVDFAPGSPPHIGRPHVLFVFAEGSLPLLCGPIRCYDVAPDGQRFYAVQYRTRPRPPVVTRINLIQNWLEELKAKVPTR